MKTFVEFIHLVLMVLGRKKIVCVLGFELIICIDYKENADLNIKYNSVMVLGSILIP